MKKDSAKHDKQVTSECAPLPVGDENSGSVTTVKSTVSVQHRSNLVIERLLQKGPKLSSKLIDELSSEMECERATARKYLSRCPADVCIKLPLALERQEAVYFAKWMTPRADAVRNLLSINTGHRAYLDFLHDHDWTVAANILRTGAGLPLVSNSRPTFEEIHAQFTAAGLVKTVMFEGAEIVVACHLKPEIMEKQIGIAVRKASRHMALTEAVAKHFVDLRWIAPGTRVNSAEAQIGGFPFDISGKHYSELTDDGFAAIDISLRHVSASQFSRFSKKVETSIHAAKLRRRILPILVAPSFDRPIIEEGNKKNWQLLTFDKVLSGSFKQALDTLTDGLPPDTDSSSALVMATVLASQLSEQIRGLSFELLVFAALISQGVRDWGWSEKVKSSEGEAEIDVWVEKDGVISCYECKSSQNLISLSELKDWFSRQIPRIREAKPNAQKFYFVGLSGLTDEAKNWVEKTSPKKFEIYVLGEAATRELMPQKAYRDALKKLVDYNEAARKRAQDSKTSSNDHG